MLRKLFISNFALIDQVEINFEKEFSVITGETGAGKSILLGALGLILGNRSDHSSLKNKEKKCIVEGVFDIKEYALLPFFKEQDLDYEHSTILRREISPSGKSRSFINDTPTTLDTLKKFGSYIIDIHSQQQSFQLNNASFQLEVIDSLAQTQETLEQYKENYHAFQQLQRSVVELSEKIIESKKQEDYLNFQFQELERLDIKEGEGGTLEEEQRKFANSEEIIRNFSRLVALLSEGEENTIDRLSEIRNTLDFTLKYDSSLQNIRDRVESLLIELKDVGDELEQKATSFYYDSERHSYVEGRLGEFYRLLQKHQISEVDQLLHVQTELEKKLMNIDSYEEELKGLETQKESIEKLLHQLASSLSEQRKSVLQKLEKDVESSLKELGIPDAKFKVACQEMNEFTRNGKDKFEFLFSANKGISPIKVAKSASGGEISRLMLSIKKIVADQSQLPTILFDEIDTGVSGEVAEKVGNILKEMSRNRQVVAITHLPQLAAKGKQHLFVYKSVEKDRSITKIKELNQEARVEELAKMLSGARISDAAINNAKELLTQ